MAKESLEQKVENLQKTVESLQQENERLQAFVEIQNLMCKCEYLHMANRQKEKMELHANKAPDGSVCIQEAGTWKGLNAGRRAWAHMDEKLKTEWRIGMMSIHPVTTFVIEVAKDAKTAKGMWLGNGLVASNDEETGKPQAWWEWDKVGVDFVKEDGKWKIWHYHVYTIFRAYWDDKWEEQFTKPRVIMSPDELKADGPSTDYYPYNPNTEYKYVPAPPEPYETWDGKSMA